MKIVIFTQEDPFYVKVFFDIFFGNFKPLHEIKAVVISQPMGRKSFFDLARQMYDFYGAYHFLEVGFRYVYLKLMGRRSLQMTDPKCQPKTYTVKQLAEAYGLKVIERSDLNSADFLKHINQYDADLFISVASPIIFKGDLIKVPKLDCINIHNAPLPKYRGMLPNFWQLYYGEKEGGITIHKITAGIDGGDIILQRNVIIDPYDTLNKLIIKTKKMGAMFMIEVIDAFRKGKVEYRKMEGKASYFTFPKRVDVAKFKKRGKRIF